MKNENLINEILDKVSDFGINSLTDDDLYILKNKGELPKHLEYKTKLNLEDGYEKKGDVEFYYDKVYLIEIEKKETDFLKNISEFLNEMFYIIEINGYLDINNKKYTATFFLTIDKEDSNIEKSIEWDSDLFENNGLSEYKNDVEDILIEIIKKYINHLDEL